MPFRLATLKLFGQSLSGNKKIAPKHDTSEQIWCRWRESNPHGGLAQRILSPPRLPVPTHRHTFMNTLLRTLPKKQEGYAGGMLMKLETLYQKSNEFATPFPELGKTDATHFESTTSTIPSHRQVLLQYSTDSGKMQEKVFISAREDMLVRLPGRVVRTLFAVAFFN